MNKPAPNAYSEELMRFLRAARDGGRTPESIAADVRVCWPTEHADFTARDVVALAPLKAPGRGRRMAA